MSIYLQDVSALDTSFELPLAMDTSVGPPDPIPLGDEVSCGQMSDVPAMASDPYTNNYAYQPQDQYGNGVPAQPRTNRVTGKWNYKFILLISI